MIITSGVFLIDNRDKILMVHPTNHRWDVWGIPKGVIEIGESSIDGALRELQEETDIDLYKLMKLFGYEYHYIGQQKYKATSKTIDGHLFRINSNLSNLELKCTSLIENTGQPECDKFKWIDIEESLDWLHESQVKLLENYLTKL
jgi:8-oxo-dGTP pyrophosphatase MutT (NUDIX family)